MRRLVVALVLAVLALSLTACGGSKPPATSAQTTQTPSGGTGGQSGQPAPAAGQPGGEKPALPDLSPIESEPGKTEPFPEMRPSPPSAVADRLEAKQPMLLYFFDKAQPATDDQKAEIDAVMKDYRGLIDLVSFDAAAALDDSTKDATAAADSAGLAAALKVDYTPYIVIVDRRGEISWRARGFVDGKLIEREVLRATQ